MLESLMQDHAEEMLDLVDANDNVIGSVPRSKANSDPKIFHREIGVIIFDKKTRFFSKKGH